MDGHDIAKAVNVKAEQLHRERKRQSLGHQEPVTGAVPIGAFVNLAGATVSVTLKITVDTSTHTEGVATCSGFGCTSPTYALQGGGRFHSVDHAQLSEYERQKACQWAQVHAETCRALPGD